MLTDEKFSQILADARAVGEKKRGEAEAFELKRDTTIEELVEQGLISEEEREALVVEGSETMIELLTDEDVVGDNEELVKVANWSPEEMLKALKEYAGQLVKMGKGEFDLTKDPEKFPTKEGKIAGKTIKRIIKDTTAKETKH